MIFEATYPQVLDGTKTQTRPLVNGETFIENHLCQVVSVYKNGRLKWQVGKTYGVQQKRGWASIARIKITTMRRERLQNITEQDALAEGISPQNFYTGVGIYEKRYITNVVDSEGCTEYHENAVDAYRALWDSIHIKTGERWADNPYVWVLTFEVMP